MSGLGLIFNRFLPSASAITVAGTTVGTATTLTNKAIYIIGTSGGGHFARVATAAKSDVYFIYNKSGSTITILPFSGDFINGADSSTGISLLNLQGTFMWAMDDTDWKALTMDELVP